MFKVEDLLKSTQGKLINEGKDTIINGVSTDTRTIKENEAFVAIKGNNFDGHDFIDDAIKKGSTCVIKNLNYKKPKVKNVAFIEVKDTQKALGNIARFWRKRFNIPVIAVTGSNGKTTTKDMIVWMLSKKFKVLKNLGTKNNQIGLPLTLLNLNKNYNIAVLELGTNHFGEINYLAKICQPNIAVITNIGYAHLEYLKNLEGVFREKYSLMNNLNKPEIAILNADDVFLNKKVMKKTKSPIIFSFSIKTHGDFFADDIKMLNGKIEFSINKAHRKYEFILNTLGKDNIYNALASIAVARIFGVEYKDIINRLTNFVFPEGRLKLITLHNIRFIDDTYNSNPVSLQQALNALDSFQTKGRKIFIMGDMLELGDYKELFHHQVGHLVAAVCDAFITVGKLSCLAADVAKTAGLDTRNVFTCTSIQEARDILLNKISPKKEDIILVKGSRLMKMEDVFSFR